MMRNLIVEITYWTLHFRNCERSTYMADFLNLGSDEKSTLADSEFQTLTVRSVKKLLCFKFSHCALYSLYGCPLVGNDVKVTYLLTSRHINPKTIS